MGDGSRAAGPGARARACASAPPPRPVRHAHSAPPHTNAYAEACRQRVHLSRLRMREQLLRELGRLERLQARAVQGVRLHRVMSAGLRAAPRTPPPPVPPPPPPAARRRLEALLAQRPLFPVH